MTYTDKHELEIPADFSNHKNEMSKCLRNDAIAEIIAPSPMCLSDEMLPTINAEIGGNITEINSHALDPFDATDSLTNLVEHLADFKTEKATGDNKQRDNLFHTRCLVQGKDFHMIIDSGSCRNLVITEIVSQLQLDAIYHPRPYKLG